MVFAPRVKQMYETLKIDYHEKLLVYSDALNVKKALKIEQQCREFGFEKGMSSPLPSPSVSDIFPVAFGIGTFFTNDFRKLSSGLTEESKALNMVIKISSVNGTPCVKISDDLNKVNFFFVWQKILKYICTHRTLATKRW